MKQGVPSFTFDVDSTLQAIATVRAVAFDSPSLSAASRQVGAAITVMISAAVSISRPSPSYVRVAESVTEAASLASIDGSTDVWESMLADANWLSNHGSKDYLINQPLWLNEVRRGASFRVNLPLWTRRPLDSFDRSTLTTNGSWGVWPNWYRALLVAAGPSLMAVRRELSASVVIQGNNFWIRDPDKVTDDVARMLGWMSSNRRFASTSQQARRSQQSSAELNQARRLLLGLIWSRATPERLVESVEPQSDEPTADDQLGRKPFAQALVERMDRIFQKGGHDGFAAHIYAPWGAGKTSVLMMMRDLMIAKDRKSSDGRPAPHWVVVGFNAWEQERRNPPWWPLVEAVKSECLIRLCGSGGGWGFALAFLKEWWLKGYQIELQPALLQLRWTWWKLKTDALPYVVFLAVFAAAFSLLWAGSTISVSEFALKVFAAAVTAFATFLGASRIAVFGSSSNAKFYDDISQDPLMRITSLFRSIVEKTNAPICIFIDDLDRCRSEYVVDLLEGIQTSFRHKNVAYVVAADRSWIKASFEARYGAFSDAVSNLGQPLGYLFLEKVFQVSTPVPGMGDVTRSAYWNRLLRGASVVGRLEHRDAISMSDFGDSTPAQFDRTVEARRAELREQHGSNLTREQAEVILEKSDSAEERAAIVLELNASPAAEREAEHLLARFTGVLPDNPRVMKRTVNAFAMRQAIGLLERSGTPSDILARWTILEQRFPSLADLLIEHPEWTRFLFAGLKDSDRQDIPPSMLAFANSKVVQSIVGSSEDRGLTPEQVLSITRGSKT